MRSTGLHGDQHLKKMFFQYMFNPITFEELCKAI